MVLLSTPSDLTMKSEFRDAYVLRVELTASAVS